MFPRFIAPALTAALILLPATAFSQSHDMTGMETPPADHTGHDMAAMPPNDDARSPWHVMTHGTLTLVADHQSGPRGDDKTFVEGMVMIMAHRRLDDSTDLELQAMLSPDAFMGKYGYPLLLQAGETADGLDHLTDRQHPHDLLMGLTATLSHRFNDVAKASLMAGYPGEFAFGPTAFMHRPSGENFPTAPISHHWLDSGHITMGVVTGAFEYNSLKLEISQFTGREPDQYRFNLDPVRLDSTSLRAVWRITPALSAQASWAHQVSAEQLEPDVDLDKTSLSLAYTRLLPVGRWDATLAWGRKAEAHGTDKPSDAFLIENALHFDGPWIGLLRYERVYNDELAPGAYWVAKTELGAVRTFKLGHGATLGLGVVQQFNTVPDALKPAYGDNPTGTVGFMTLKFSSMSGM